MSVSLKVNSLEILLRQVEALQTEYFKAKETLLTLTMIKSYDCFESIDFSNNKILNCQEKSEGDVRWSIELT